MLKDHLSNLRIAYHPGEHTHYRALLNTDDAEQIRREQRAFNSTSVSIPIRQPVTSQFAYEGNGVAVLNAGGTQPHPLGHLKQLMVTRGDTLEVTAFGLY